MAAAPKSDPLAEIERWQSEGVHLRERLVADLEAARSRVAELEKALTRLPAAPARENGVRFTYSVHDGAALLLTDRDTGAPAHSSISRFVFPLGKSGKLGDPDAAEATLPQLVLRAISEHPGASPGRLAEVVHGYGKAFDRRHIYTYLYRLRKQGLVRIEGPRSDRKYFINTHPNQEEEETDVSNT